MLNMEQIQALVGPVTEEDLAYVDCYTCDGFGIFIPSVGFCGYAVRPQHTHPAYSGVITVTGCEGLFTPELVPDDNHYLAALLAPDVPHAETPQEEFQRYFAIFISKERFHEACAICDRTAPSGAHWRQFLLSRQVVSWIHTWMRECEPRAPGHPHIAAHWASIILCELVRQGCGGGDTHLPPDHARPMDGILQYMQQHYEKPLPVTTLAALAHMSESSFHRAFRAAVGESPAKHLLNIRLNKAKHLLRATDFTVAQIAASCGFSSSAHFSSCFQSAFHLSPSVFRKNRL